MDYTWTQQKSFDEHAMLSYLPMKMRTDIAMRVHYSTLGKVKLFKNCEPGLLKDLVVLLRPIIYLPGDYICRKNDIGKEMFIIQSGQVQVNIISICSGETGRNTKNRFHGVSQSIFFNITARSRQPALFPVEISYVHPYT